MPIAAPAAAAAREGAPGAPSPRALLRLEIRGAVQGVGFRPFVYRLARELALDGWVRNDSHGVEIEVEGPRDRLESFVARLALEKPAPALLQSVAASWLKPPGHNGFAIRASAARAGTSAVVLPDLATCAECRSETFTPGDRRFHYPFTNCTHCGPRFSIVLGLPYDRPSTTMRGFELCPACRAEYEDPVSRRFHAQPNACPECGPELRSTNPDGQLRARRAAALDDVVAALKRGDIVALKGIGGFQLLCDARSAAAVAKLRTRKHRPAKPLALMVRDVGAARRLCAFSAEEAALLASPQAPIVLLRRRTLPGVHLAPEIAPGNPRLGVMLPTSPLHHLLFAEVDFPLVATSGNLSDEPIAIDDGDALARLGGVGGVGGIADLFLLHDRPIARHVDDSVAWLLDGGPQLLRRARGYAPLPVVASRALPCMVATGAHQKAAAAVSIGNQIFLSQHLGDMETPEAHAAFERVILDFLALYGATPVALVHDLHPDYPTTRWAARAGCAAGGLLERAGLRPQALPRFAVQHHHAHLAACLAEHDAEPGGGTGKAPGGRSRISGPALGFSFDGTGYGPDGTIWGGEALVVPEAAAPGSFYRLARLRPFRLPGGEAAVREPRRVALALLHELEGAAAFERRDIAALASFSPAESAILAKMLTSGWNAPWTSSMGRLFDGVAALLGIGGSGGSGGDGNGDGARVSYEGEAAMALEFAADSRARGTYPLPLVEGVAPAGLAPGQLPQTTLHELDWRPLVAALLADRARGEALPRIAARFHQALVDGALAVARLSGLSRVALSGGCFQNRLLSERLAASLRAADFTVFLHRAVPPNDGGIALGQIAVAAARLAAE
jgi:hydrogenase maturation protein HypF